MMVARKQKEMETDPHIVYNLTKMEWAILLGMIGGALEVLRSDDAEIVSEQRAAAGKLAAQFGGKFNFGVFQIDD
jgi:hypothetical protein